MAPLAGILLLLLVVSYLPALSYGKEGGLDECAAAASETGPPVSPRITVWPASLECVVSRSDGATRVKRAYSYPAWLTVGQAVLLLTALGSVALAAVVDGRRARRRSRVRPPLSAETLASLRET